MLLLVFFSALIMDRNDVFCVHCVGEKYKPHKNGVTMRLPNYRGHFHADLLKCPRCKDEIITRIGSECTSSDCYISHDFKNRREEFFRSKNADYI